MPTSKEDTPTWKSINVTPHTIHVTEDNRLGMENTPYRFWWGGWTSGNKNHCLSIFTRPPPIFYLGHLPDHLPGVLGTNTPVWVRAFLADQILVFDLEWFISHLHLISLVSIYLRVRHHQSWKKGNFLIMSIMSTTIPSTSMPTTMSATMSATSSATIGFWKQIQHLKNENQCHEKMPENATFTMKVKVPPKGQGQNKRAKTRRAKHRAKITGQKLQGKNRGQGQGQNHKLLFSL